jgi:magnesium-transporting ATPase (P-type)
MANGQSHHLQSRRSGAPASPLHRHARCRWLTHPLEPDAIRQEVEKWRAKGLRVLAFARRHATHDQAMTLQHEHVQEGLTFLGLQGMIDPPRPEAIAAVAHCRALASKSK